jgi:hypothetical protein
MYQNCNGQIFIYTRANISYKFRIVINYSATVVLTWTNATNKSARYIFVLWASGTVGVRLGPSNTRKKVLIMGLKFY